MPGTSDDHAELFARALDAMADRPRDLSGDEGVQPDRRPDLEPDADLARDLAIADALGSLRDVTGPDDAARERMRARALAGFVAARDTAGVEAVRTPSPRPRHAVDDEPEEPPALSPGRRGARRSTRPGPGGPADTRPARGRHGVHGRLLAVIGASLCLLVALSGTSLVFARDALPGDMLYGIKRTAESAQLGATFGDESRGFRHLDFATARVNEIEALAVRGDDDADRFLTALEAFDIDAAAGSRLLIDVGTSGAGDKLATLADWGRQQQARVKDAGAVMPTKASVRAGGSLALLDKIVGRATALEARLRCATITSGTRDDVGLLPSDAECVPTGSSAPPVPGDPAPTGTPGATSPGGGPTVSGTPTAGGAPVPPLDPFEPGGPLPPAGLPELPEPPVDGPESLPAGDGGTTGGGEGLTVPLPLPLSSITLPPLG